MIRSMKKHLSLLVLFVISIANSQEKNAPEKTKDTIIKTEVVKVVTSYVPKITDAFKIKQKPIIKHTKETQKKELEYKIFSVPVASTFIPKSGVMKKVDLGKREQLYPNYFSLGLGNKITPFLEAYVRRNESYDSEYGVHLKFLLSADPVEKTQLSSTYYNMNLNLFYAQQERYLNWRAGISAGRNKYNWYGLPKNITFTDATISRIEEEQAHNLFKVFGTIKFDDSYIEEANGSISFFSDVLSSSEFLIDGNAKFKVSLDRFHRELNDLYINTTFSYLGGKFDNSYETQDELKHSFFTVGVHPTYKFLVQDLAIKIGAKSYFSLDIQNKGNNFFIYPDVEISYPIVNEFANIFVGASGDLETNSYKSLVDKNPHISPTQQVLQTNKKYDAFAGIRGKLDFQFSYNFKASYAAIENNPFISLNQSKSNGTNNAGTNAFSFLGYEYGNSFNTTYDDIKLMTFFGEIAYDGIKNLTLGVNGKFNKFTLTNELEAWNAPKIEGELFGTYKVEKWFAGANLFFVGQRKGKLHEILPLDTFTTVDIDSYFDINFNGGYHFNDSFSVFLNLNNVLNNSYQRFNNFNVQGFQAMGGLTWKFDTLF
ncbi:hypothetical protein [Tenacibaculum ovolyticum]|uniref:hypothetical protein n=1 Tax=Tenacibaculum ovolyticum TaxID=104270 RepID=UPI000A4B3E48|nr:hypothetical protein [Tenacibaculum ovolyticum]